MEMISEILKKYDTDKVKGHNYGPAYDEIFSTFDRESEINILEIGVQKGESLLAWREYFPKAKITGIDIVDQVKNKVEGINYITADINDYKTDEMFDIVIDDGSHWLKDVIHSVSYFSNKLNRNGILIIEDVQKAEVWVPAISNIVHPKLPYNKYKFEISIVDVRAVDNQSDDFLIILQNVNENN